MSVTWVSHIKLSSMWISTDCFAAPLGLLFIVSTHVQLISLHGTNRITLSSGVSPYTVDFDHRYRSSDVPAGLAGY